MSDERVRVLLTAPREPDHTPTTRGGVLADWQIEARMALPEGDPQRLVISPFDPGTSLAGRVSSGKSSYGYDLRLGNKFRVFTNTGGCVIDVRDFKADALVYQEGPHCIVPPNAYVLAETVEYLEIPEDVLVVVLGKSSYARAGIGLNMTPLEPGWRGKVTLEIANHTPLPARVWAGDGIGQAVFLEGSQPCLVPYSRKPNPRYQDQKGLTLPKV